MTNLTIALLRRRSFLPLAFSAICAAPAFSQTCSVAPRQAKLGETLRITCPPEFSSATLNGRTAKLFPQSTGNNLGLLPISVKDAPGPAKLTVSRIDGGQEPLSITI